ncbi:MAG: hypothetical protein KY475_00045 [Planctomycetes bacterium]|nr:hypothetical protein [Planctomycetota bacterium]
MNLSPDQIQALEHGEAVAVTVEGREYMVLSREVYDNAKRVMELDPRDTYPAVMRPWDSYGSPDDATLYQDVEPE